MRGALFALLGELRHERRAMVATMGLATVSLLILGALAVLPAFVLGRAVVRGEAPDPSFWAVMAALVLVRGLLTWAEMDASHSLAYRILARLRMALFDRYAVALPTKRRENVGHAAATAMHDTESLEFFYAHTIAQLLAGTVNVLVGLLLLAAIHPPLAAVVLVSLLAVTATARLGRARLRALGEVAADQTSALSSRIVDLLGGLREVLGYNLQGRVRVELAASGAAAATTAGRLETLNRMLAGAREATVTLAAVAVLTLAVLGGVPAEHLAGLVVLSLVTIAPAADAAETLSQLHPLRASAGRVRGELTRPSVAPEARATTTVPDGPLGLAFHHVSFGYDDRRVLDGFELEVAPGEHVGVTGPSGVGKSTLIALAGRLWDPDEGVVGLVSRDQRISLTTVSDTCLREVVGVVEQDGVLFSGSVADNLLEDTGTTIADLEDSLARAGLQGVLTPDDVIGESGIRLSGGQQARLRLIRALLRRPRILVVDEPTADLDADSAELMHAMLSSYRGTLLVVSHRQATLADMNRTITLAHVRDRASI